MRAPAARAAGVCLLACALAACASADAEYHDGSPARRPERPRFSFDAGAIWQRDSAMVAVDIALPYRELMFRSSEAGFAANFDLIVVLYDGDRQLTGDLWHEKLQVRTQVDARSEANVYQRLILLHARPGKVRVEVTVSEQASGNEGRLSQEIEIPDIAREDLVVGKLWFGRCVPDSAGRALLLPDEPLVARRFGAAVGPVCVWSHLYGKAVRSGEPIALEYKVYDEHREVLAHDTVAPPAAGPEAPICFHLPIANLWLGGYELRFSVRVGKETVTRIADFDMDESMVSMESNPVESIALVRYIASAAEIDSLQNAAPEDRQKVWDRFWERRNPSPGSGENEFKQQFFARVRYANEHFSSLGPGWKTDRGMIYIQYGAPDQIEAYPHNIDGPPYEIWSYYALRRRFVFVDYDGFGRYELYTPGRG